MGDLVLVDRDARGVATVTLNRPEARNAMSSAVIAELNTAYDEVLDNDDVVCVVLTGTDPAFCAGMDLREMGAGGGNLTQDFHSRIWATSTPVIGAINGAAVTGGFELALACDILIASERARFADTHARVGLISGAGMSVLLPAAVGMRRASEMSLTGRYVNAEEALRWGLVNKVVPHAELMTAAIAVAHEIAACDHAAVKRMNRLMKDTSRLSKGDGLDHEADKFRAFVRGMDYTQVEERRESVIAHGRSQTQ